MRASAIRHLAAATDAPRIAAAFFQQSVQIWDLQAGTCSLELETVLDYGGRRITMSPRGDVCVTAAWKKGKRGGIACYDATTGACIWRRTDIRRTQHIRFSASGVSLWSSVEGGSLQSLDPRTGETVDALAGIQNVFDNRFDCGLLLDRRGRDFSAKGPRDFSIPRTSFALLDAAHSPRYLCLSEACGPVRCFDRESGEERWRLRMEEGKHFVSLWYRAVDSSFYGVELEYERGPLRRLVRIAAEDGHREDVCTLDSWEESFCGGADCLVTSSGQMIDLATGSVVKELSFPEMEYSDTERAKKG